MEALPGTDIVLSSLADVRHVLPKAETSARMIFVAFAGVNHLAPFDWVPDGAVLVNNSGATAQNMGEYTVFAAGLLANGVVQTPQEALSQRMPEKGFASLSGKCATIIGTGGVGLGAARMCRAFRMTVTGVNRSGAARDGFDRIFPTENMQAAIAQADFVILACPVTEQTTGLVDAPFLAAMKPGSCLVNVARGQIVDEDALCEAVSTGHLGGAVLDVVTSKGHGSRIRSTPGILVTPHVSGDDALHYIDNTLDVFFDNLSQLLDGCAPSNRVDPVLGY